MIRDTNVIQLDSGKKKIRVIKVVDGKRIERTKVLPNEASPELIKDTIETLRSGISHSPPGVDERFMPVPNLSPKKSCGTIRQYAKLWLERRPGSGSEPTWKHRAQILRDYILPALGNKKFDDPNLATDFNDLRLALRCKGLADPTIDSIFGVLSVLFAHAAADFRDLSIRWTLGGLLPAGSKPATGGAFTPMTFDELISCAKELCRKLPKHSLKIGLVVVSRLSVEAVFRIKHDEIYWEHEAICTDSGNHALPRNLYAMLEEYFTAAEPLGERLFDSSAAALHNAVRVADVRRVNGQQVTLDMLRRAAMRAAQDEKKIAFELDRLIFGDDE